MEEEQKENKTNAIDQGEVHVVLAYSYFIFLFAIILGVILDIFIKYKIFYGITYQRAGFFMIVISSLIIYWAQSTSANYVKNINKSNTRSQFEYGPYRYLRCPTHFGLFIMMLGFSLIINSLFSVIFTIIAYAISKLYFLKKEEDILEKKYGQVYTDYKKKVRNWI